MKTKRFLSILLCIVMLGGLLSVGANAQDEICLWAVDDGGEPMVAARSELPAKYDLRDEGLVTPVKLQNPWGSCWAFGGIAAAETSILSAFGSTYAASGLDLSERHLTYFALQPVTESVSRSQAGEGLITIDPSPNAAFDAGGAPIYITTLFSQGTGPVPESSFPYRGANALTNTEYFDQHPDEATLEELSAAAEAYGMTAEEFIHMRAEQKGKTDEEMFAYFREAVRDVYASSPSYSKHDDWSIPELDGNGHPNRLLSSGVVLKDGNVLPAYRTSGETVPNADSINAMKQELVNGHGVIIGFFADQSGEYTMTSDEGGSQYNQYIDRESGTNHSVCVVGWDDGYAAENFKITPPGNGAWIVKNSWGSTLDAATDDLGTPVGRSEYGVKNAEGEYTGYFYLSYYDQTIVRPETMEFTANLANDEGFYTLQYDYMPAQGGFFSTQPDENVVSAANVFVAGGDAELKSVSTRTSAENMRVTFAVYLLEDDAENPTDGELVCRTSKNFEYSGFHRMDLDQPIVVEEGQAFSVVTTASVLNENGKREYSVAANLGATREQAEYYGVKCYSNAVVNEGESWLYVNGEWGDWSEYLAENATVPVDNFSIKAYAVDAELEPTPTAVPGDLNHDGSV
ncbi:MAG: hypothetical protein IJT18_03210, partial [Oscillospiraceae bacterium]|nr:hypothetical protein [Oscillospiraceae bacterium]